CALPIGERFDVIVSNPPYVAEAERADLAPEVAAHEPAMALFAAGDGLAVIAAIVEAAPDRLETGGLLALEMGAGQGAAVLSLLERAGRYTAARVRQDLAGRDRIALAEKAQQLVNDTGAAGVQSMEAQ